MHKFVAGVIIAIIVAGILWLFLVYGGKQPSPSAPPQHIASANYQCDQGRTIAASYFQGPQKPPAANGQPQPNGSVEIILSDGRSESLNQTISADGIRYSNGDPQKEGSETMVFWSKGHGAMLQEGGQQTYSGCIEIADDPGGLPNVYESSPKAFSVRYPGDYTADESYQYTELGPGQEINGVKFTIASSTAAGTNLAPDTYLSVEAISIENPASSTCGAELFLDGGSSAATSTSDSGVEYSFATSSGAAAGNRYDETVYALLGTNPCMGVRYFVHYGVLANYPAGSVQPYDDQALHAQFDAMRRTLMLEQ